MTTSNRNERRRRLPAAAALAAAALAGAALAGCGAGTAGHQSVAVGPASAGSPAAAARPTTAARSTGARVGQSAAALICRPAHLRADQVPVLAGTGQSFLAWSLTNTGPTACVVPGGQPSLAFVDGSGRPVIAYAVAHLPTVARAGAAVRVAPGRAAWFLTEESTTDCGTGTVIGGGPFHYLVRLPGGAGALSWTASYLSGPTLSDFCGAISLQVGDIQATAPTA